jgi:Tfp pilus assembly protein PilF
MKSGMRWLVMGAVVLAAAASFAQDMDALTKRKVCRQLLKKVRVQFEEARPDSAAYYATMAMDCDPSQPDTYWYLAHAHLALEDPVEARRIIDLGVERAPMSQRLALQKARFCLQDGDLDQARSIVQRVLILPRHKVEALYLRGQVELAEGDSLTAMETWHEALLTEFPAGGAR